MTAISTMSSNIELSKLYDKIDITDIVKFIEHKEKYKGYSKKLDKKTRKKTARKTFYNQVTIHIYHNNKIVNVKLFNNGKIQMTGLKYELQGKEVLEILKKMLVNKNENDIFDTDDLEILDYKIVLINSDFDIKYKVNREKLHREIINLGLYSTYEPCMYPGVNIKYYYNNINSDNNLGICNCNCKCDGKGEGNGQGDCKKVTIAVFNSGKIIITGGKNRDQLIKSYEFITKVLKNKEKLSYDNI